MTTTALIAVCGLAACLANACAALARQGQRLQEDAAHADPRD